MAQSPRLDLRGSQTLTMTPQLRQAIGVLGMGSQELTAYVSQVVEMNPFLDVPDGDATGLDGMDMGEVSPPNRDDPTPLNGSPDDFSASDAGALEADSAAYIPGEGSGGGGAGAGGALSEAEDLLDRSAALSTTQSLTDHLTGQIASLVPRAEDALIARALVDWLDDAGLFRDDPADVAAMLGVPTRRVIAVLNRLKGCEPVGLFAQSLSECLELQLAERDQLTPALETMLENLALIAEGQLGALAKRCGVNRETLGEMLALLRTLNPRPASAFHHALAPVRIPDILVSRRPDGTWQVELNPETLPRVLADERYYATLAQGRDQQDADTRKYLSEQWSQAQWLVRTLDQRARTTLKVATEVMRHQADFLNHGIMSLKPLTLKTVADAVEVHESTVSRVTQARTISTPRGLFDMKFFFTQAIQSRHQSVQFSAEAVRHRIKTLVDAETAQTVLSDDQLVEILTAEGIEIARRTVAKYREALGIPSSVKRRRRLK